MTEQVNPVMVAVARESRGLSQQELAKATGIPQSTISKYENGILQVSEADLRTFCKVLDYTPDLFFQREPIHGIGSSFLFHRKRKEVPMVMQRKAQACINILKIQIARLLRSAEIEAES